MTAQNVKVVFTFQSQNTEHIFKFYTVIFHFDFLILNSRYLSVNNNLLEN